MTKGITGLLTALLLVAVWTGESAAREPVVFSWERYEVLVERNIFSPDRSVRNRLPVEPVVPEYRPERSITVTGVVRDGDKYVAFLEDTRARTTSKVVVGGSVARGIVTEIALDHIVYESEGEAVVVPVGERLDSSAPSQSPSPQAAESAVTEPAGPAPGAAPPAGESESAILERLRQRRQKELD